MLKADAVLKIFQDNGALFSGHFQLSSGLHSGKYLQCALVLQYPQVASKLGKALAGLFPGEKIDSVIAPAVGGIIVAHEVARALRVKAIFTERVEGKMALRRGFSIVKGERVLVVEDVLTTGGSVKEVMEVVKSGGGLVVGVGVLVNRSGGSVNLGVKCQALLSLDIEVFPPRDCPLCRERVPLEKPGSRYFSVNPG